MFLKIDRPDRQRAPALFSLLLLASSGYVQAQQVSGSAGLVSDYVWRGSSQSRENPAAQAGLKYSHSSGVYASLWASTVRFEPDNGARGEFDLALGWARALSEDWSLDAYLLRYQYPNADTNLNWNEINAVLSWRQHYWIALAYSPKAMASQAHGLYALAGARYPINRQWRLEATLARYLLQDAQLQSYTHGSLGLIWTFTPHVEARITLHATDSAAKRLFADMAGSRAEFAIQAAF